VVIYSKSWCPYCSQCKSLFDGMGVEYTAIELDEREDGPAIQEVLLGMTQQRTVPNVFVGGQHLGGNDDTQQAARSGQLAALLDETAQTGRVVPEGAGSGASAASQQPVNDFKTANADPVSQLFSTLFAGGSGKQIFFGVLQREVDAASVPSDAERAHLRTAAAADLTNIDAAERERRQLAGGVMSVLTAALAAALLASDVAPPARAAIAPPLFLAYGYLASARTGL